jgi:uncharacterized protein (TIGR02594 family)
MRIEEDTAAQTKPDQFRVAADTLYVRGAPSTSAGRIGTLTKGMVIEKTGENDAKDWIKILLNGIEGWVSTKYLLKVPYLPPLGEDFAWMAIAEAEKEKEIHEIPGEENDPQVLEYFTATSNLSKSVRSKDETPWCSAFANWCLKQAGYEGTRNAAARSWMDWGEAIETPRRGCIVVFQREGGGHVGFYIGETETEILVLGGNQQNRETLLFEVSEKYYLKSNLLGYRIPG